jgi:hypothetical protein
MPRTPEIQTQTATFQQGRNRMVRHSDTSSTLLKTCQVRWVDLVYGKVVNATGGVWRSHVDHDAIHLSDVRCRKASVSMRHRIVTDPPECHFGRTKFQDFWATSESSTTAKSEFCDVGGTEEDASPVSCLEPGPTITATRRDFVVDILEG